MYVGEDKTTVTFFFGERVVIGNVAGEQCLEVYVDVTIKNTPLLISGTVIDFTAVVVMDFFAMTDPETISFEVNYNLVRFNLHAFMPIYMYMHIY